MVKTMEQVPMQLVRILVIVHRNYSNSNHISHFAEFFDCLNVKLFMVINCDLLDQSILAKPVFSQAEQFLK